jgi:starch synthase
MKLALINNSITPKDLDVFKDLNNTAMFKGGATYADAITFGAETLNKNC